jgi:hypothetical protein
MMNTEYIELMNRPAFMFRWRVEEDMLKKAGGAQCSACFENPGWFPLPTRVFVLVKARDIREEHEEAKSENPPKAT